MRDFGQSLVIVCLAAGAALAAQAAPQAPPPAAPAPSPQAIENAAKLLADVRKALGGDQKLTGVKTLVANGRTKRVSGENLVPVEFEIDLELPDNYVRKDEIPA